jgi:hypothetical protein
MAHRQAHSHAGHHSHSHGSPAQRPESSFNLPSLLLTGVGRRLFLAVLLSGAIWAMVLAAMV